MNTGIYVGLLTFSFQPQPLDGLNLAPETLYYW